jgi:glycosyltransferase involved in cell wall biosynthesis
MSLPVVASSIPGCVDAVRDGITGILTPARETQGLICALQALLSDSKTRDAMGKAGSEWIRNQSEAVGKWELLVAEYRAVLELGSVPVCGSI